MGIPIGPLRYIQRRQLLRVTVLSCVFPPETVVSGKISQEIAAGLAATGHSVTVITSFPSRPGGRIFPGYRRSLYHRKKDPAGYELLRCFTVPSQESSAASRFIENIIFGLSAAGALLFSPRPDVIYSNTWPVFASALMSLVAALRRIPYVIVIQDVYPESYAIQGRASHQSLTFRVMRWMDTQITRRAAHVVAISPAFAQIYREDRKVPAERISIIPNWAVSQGGAGCEADAARLRERFSIPREAFLAAYGGNIGVAAGVETMVKAFRHLNGSAYGLIAGEGSQLATCQKLAEGLGKLSFFHPWPPDQTIPLYQASDVLVLPTQGGQSMASVPSKLISYMLSGRPVIAAGLPGSELSKLMTDSGCGWLVPPDQPEALAEKILHVKTLDPCERARRGEAGRKYALEHLTSAACLPKVIDLIERGAR